MERYDGRMFLASDLHLGKLSSNIEMWFPTMEKWAMEWFLPLLKKEYKRGDFLMLAGDLTDNQETLHLKVKDFLDRYIHELSKIMPVHIIEGNHDLLDGGDSGESPSAISHYKYFPNVFLHQDSHMIQWGDNKTLLQPWIRDRHKFLDKVKSMGGDILVAHTDVRGCKMGSRSMPLQEGLETKEFPFKKVYTGHIHIRQRIDNFLFIGSPYHMDLSDLGDDKGIWIMDPNDGNERFVSNIMSPKFMEYRIDDVSQIKDIDPEVIKNNWCDLYLHAAVPLQAGATKQVAELMKWNWKRYYRYGYELEEVDKLSFETKSFTMDSKGIKHMANIRVSGIEDESLKKGVSDKLNLLFDIWENKKTIDEALS